MSAGNEPGQATPRLAFFVFCFFFNSPPLETPPSSLCGCRWQCCRAPRRVALKTAVARPLGPKKNNLACRCARGKIHRRPVGSVGRLWTPLFRRCHPTLTRSTCWHSQRSIPTSANLPSTLHFSTSVRTVVLVLVVVVPCRAVPPILALSSASCETVRESAVESGVWWATTTTVTSRRADNRVFRKEKNRIFDLLV